MSVRFVTAVAWLLVIPALVAISAVQVGEWLLFAGCCLVFVVGVVVTFRMAMASLLVK